MDPTWQSDDGAVKLWLGDCLDILSRLEPGSVDAVVTDPPYCMVTKFGKCRGGGGKHGGLRVMQFDWDGSGQRQTVRDGLRLALNRVRPPGAAVIFSGLDVCGDIVQELRDAAMVPKLLAWVKKCPPPAGHGNWWPSAFELAFYAYHRGAWFGDRDTHRSNVFVFDSYRHGQPGKVAHPTQKPLRLIMRLVLGVVPPGRNALDPFMGSGTTGVACVRTGRKFVGIEKDPAYFAIAVDRIKRELAQPRLPGLDEPTRCTLTPQPSSLTPQA